MYFTEKKEYVSNTLHSFIAWKQNILATDETLISLICHLLYDNEKWQRKRKMALKDKNNYNLRNTSWVRCIFSEANEIP